MTPVAARTRASLSGSRMTHSAAARGSLGAQARVMLPKVVAVMRAARGPLARRAAAAGSCAARAWSVPLIKAVAFSVLGARLKRAAASVGLYAAHWLTL